MFGGGAGEWHARDCEAGDVVARDAVNGLRKGAQRAERPLQCIFSD